MTALSPTGPPRASAPTMSPARGGTGRDGLPAASSTVLLVGDFADEASGALQQVGYTVVAPRPGEDPLVAFSRIRPNVVVAAADAGAARVRPAGAAPRGAARADGPRHPGHQRRRGRGADRPAARRRRLRGADRSRASSSPLGSRPRPPVRPSPPSWSAGTCAPACSPRARMLAEAGRELDRGRPYRRARAASGSSRSRRCLGCSTGSVVERRPRSPPR